MADAGATAKYIVLIKYTETGARKYGDDAHARSRREAGMSSLRDTLGGEVLGHYATMGPPYDQVFIMEVPAGQDRTIFQCRRRLLATGDFEVTILRAFEFREAFGP